MFESDARLQEDVGRLLRALREGAGGRYACIVEPAGLLFESKGDDASAAWMLRRFLEARLGHIFELPQSLAGTGPSEDVFAGWDEDDFVLAILNGRVALVFACSDAEAARAALDAPFAALADLLLRLRPGFRVDAQGRGLFMGRPRVDWIVAAREA